ncbi:hypothetical protein Tco_0967403 [Tanacetum coccineum]
MVAVVKIEVVASSWGKSRWWRQVGGGRDGVALGWWVMAWPIGDDVGGGGRLLGWLEVAGGGRRSPEVADSCVLGTESRLRPYLFNYPERSLIMEEMLNKFIDEGKRKHEEMRAFIYDFQTNNELLFKETNNSLIELRFGVQELLNVINNVPMIDCYVKGVTTRGGKTTTQDVHDNDTNMLPKEPEVVEP